jgi:hypothetical protein
VDVCYPTNAGRRKESRRSDDPHADGFDVPLDLDITAVSRQGELQPLVGLQGYPVGLDQLGQGGIPAGKC